jgi:predicted metal-dependent peptidase
MSEFDQVREAFIRSRVQVQSVSPFFGTLIMNLRLRPTDARVAMGTPHIDGCVSPNGDLYLAHDLFLSYSEPYRNQLILHEILHPAFLFWARMGNRDPRKWNIADDYKVNQICDELHAKFPSVIGDMPLPYRDKAYDLLTTEEIYEIIVSQPDKEGDKSSGMGGGQDAMPGQSDTNGGNNATKWKLATMEAAKVAQKEAKGDAQGYGSAGLQMLIEQMMNPVVKWSKFIQRKLGTRISGRKRSYARPQRRQFNSQFIMQGRSANTVPDVVLIVDTSGSMASDLEHMLPELNGITTQLGARIRCLVIDSDIKADVDNIGSVQDLLPNLLGGGGSDLNPAFARLVTDGYKGLVVALTDGYIGVPKNQPKGMDVVWLITSTGIRPAEYGAAVKVNKHRSTEYL